MATHGLLISFILFSASILYATGKNCMHGVTQINIFSTHTSKISTSPIQTFTGQVPNVQYGDGSDPAQVMDIYLPSLDFGSITKIIVLIHGGAWGGGQKSDMAGWVPFMQASFPSYAIANMEYRLGI